MDKYVYLTQILYKKQSINEIYKYSIFRDCILDKLAIILNDIRIITTEEKTYLSNQKTSSPIKKNNLIKIITLNQKKTVS